MSCCCRRRDLTVPRTSPRLISLCRQFQLSVHMRRDGLCHIARKLLLHDTHNSGCCLTIRQMPFLATLRQRADNAPAGQIYDLKIAAPSRELELWVAHVDRPHPHHTSHEKLWVWTASVAADRTIPSQRPARDLEPFFQQPLRQRTLRWLNLITTHFDRQDQIRREKLFEFVCEFADAVACGGPLPARSNHTEVGIIRLPQNKVSSSPSQGSDTRQLIGGLMCLL